MSDQRPTDRLLPGGRWPVTDPTDRLDELGNMISAQLVPGVLFDELYEIAVRHRAEVGRLRGLIDRLMVPCPACGGSPNRHDPAGSRPSCAPGGSHEQ